MTTNELEITSIPVDAKPLVSEGITEKSTVSDLVETVEISNTHVNGDSIPVETSSETAPGLGLPPVLKIEEGYVHKRGPRPLRLWQKRYFRLPSNNVTYPLHKLRIVYQKNAKRQTQGREDFEKANKQLIDSLATATVDARFMLTYFKTQDKEELPQGLINFKYVIDITPSPKIKPFAFTVKTETRDYVFSASNQTEADSWVTTLKALVSSDIADCSDTAAYKFSYSHLAERKGFASPISQNQDEEVFSASEAEFEPEEFTAKPEHESAIPSGTEKIQEKVSEFKNESIVNKTANRRSLYTEVIGLFQKSPKSEATMEIVPEVSSTDIKPKSSPVILSTATEPVLSQDISNGETAEESKSSEFSKEIAEMIAPIAFDSSALQNDATASPVELSSDNRPTRTKTFNMPKFEGKVFSKLFKKNSQVEIIASKEAIIGAEGEIIETSDLASETKANVSIVEALPPIVLVAEETKSDSSSKIPAPSTPEIENEEIVKFSDSPSKDEPIPDSAIDDTIRQKNPFIKRLLSGSTGNKIPTPVVSSEIDETKESEKINISPELIEVQEGDSNEDVPHIDSKVEQKENPANQRQISFIGRIGEMAYSAVSSVAEESEQISDQFVEKIKEAKHSGFLFKQSTLFHTNNLRFVILSADGVLTYFRNAQTLSEGKKIPIVGTTEVSSLDDLIISIKPISGSTYYFQAKNQEDQGAWQSALATFSKQNSANLPEISKPSTVTEDSNTNSSSETKSIEGIKSSEEPSVIVPAEVKIIKEGEEHVADITSEAPDSKSSS